MKRFNLKLFAYLLGGLILTGAALFLVHYFQSGRIADALLWQARHYEDKGDLPRTVRYLQRYLEFAPDDLEERAHLGLTLTNPKLELASGRMLNAVLDLDHVINLLPERHELRRPLIRAAILVGQLDLARDHLTVLEQKFPEDGEVSYLLGQWHEAKTQYTEARNCYQQAIKRDPKKADYRVRLAILLKQQLNQEENALAMAKKAFEVAPKDAAVLLTSANLAQGKNQLEDAWKYIQQGRKLYPHDVNFIKAEAGWYIRNAKPEEAIKCLEGGLKTLPADTHPDLLWTLANLYLDQKEVEQGQPRFVKNARDTIERIRKDKLLGEAVDYLDARLLMCRRDWSRAARLLERIRPRLERAVELTTQIDLFLGQCYERLDDPTRRLAAFERAVGRDNKSVPALVGLASAEWAVGQMEAAFQRFDQARQLGLPESGWIEFGRFLIERNRQSDNPDWPGVLKVLEKAQAGFPDSVALVLLHADVQAGQNQFQSAETELTAAKKNHPEEVELWSACVLLAENQGDLSRAQDLLADAKQHFQGQDKVELRLAQARLVIHQHGTAAARDLAPLEAPGKFTQEEQDNLLRGLADAHLRIGAVRNTVRLLTQAAALPTNQKDLRLRLRLFDLCMQLEDEPGLRQVLEQLRDLEGPQGSWWRFGRSAYLIWQAKRDSPRKQALLGEARQLLEAVALERPSWSKVFLARAEIEDLQGNEQQARDFYKSALELGENNQRIILPLTRRWQALAARGERSVDADHYLRQAVEIAPRAPEAWVSLVKYLAATNQSAAALDFIDKFAHLQAPQWVEGRLALGECYEAIGNREEARKTYEAVLDDQRTVQVVRGVASFYMRAGQQEKAKPLLESLLPKAGGDLPAADAAWARRALAMVLADGSSLEDFQNALQLVGLHQDEATGKVAETGPAADGDRVEDQRARARVLAAMNSRPLRLQAIACLKELQRRGKLEADDRLLLAQLYDAEGKTSWPDAEDLLTALVAEYKNNPHYLFRLAQSLLEHNQGARAEPYVGRLAQLEKDRTGKEGAYGSILLQARVLELKGDHDRGLALLKAYAEEKPVRLDRILAYAGYLARQNRIAAALELCEQNWQAGPPSALGGVCVGLLRSAPLRRAEDCDRAERLLRAAVKANPRSPVLQVQLADLLDLRGHYQDAEDQYRQVLALEEGNAMALNNLAWLLAQRAGTGSREARVQEALTLITRAIQLRGPLPELLDTRATVYVSLGKVGAAIADLERATREAPSAARYFHMARALRLAKKSGRAREAFQKARASGLEPRGLHPTERVAYHQIAEEFEQR